MLLNYISLPVFLISFGIGLLFAYILGPEQKKVYIYPSPENINKIMFKDKAENCFSFKEEEIECPTDLSSLFNIPLQT
jgi:hypothetical protein